MLYQLVSRQSKSSHNYLDSQLPTLKSTQKLLDVQQFVSLEKRACSSLCELSDNICMDNEVKKEVDCLKQKRRKGVIYEPWKDKKKLSGIDDKQIRIKKRISKTKCLTSQSYHEDERCDTENKQNQDSKKSIKNNLDGKRNKSIFFKIMGLSEAKGTLNLKSQHPNIEMIVCLNKKKYSMRELDQSSIHSKNEKKEEVNQIVPKVVNFDNKERQKVSCKRVEGSLLQNWSQETRGVNHESYWKSKNKKNKVYKKLLSKDPKSVEVRQIRENCLNNRKGTTVSCDKPKRDQYRSNNPLTRLLYEKYLYTIGVNQSVKEKPSKFL